MNVGSVEDDPNEAERLSMNVAVEPTASNSPVRRGAEILLQALSTEGATLDVQDFYRSFTAARDDEGKRLGSVDDVNVLPHWFVARAMAKPFLEKATPVEALRDRQLLQSVFKSDLAAAVFEGGEGTTELQSKVETLEKQVETLRAEIAELRDQ
jgi:hypothetical protein